MKKAIKKITDLFILFFGLVIVVSCTLFCIQNRVLVPVRFTFDQPVLCLLPLIVLVNITLGAVLCSIFTLLYRLRKSYSERAEILPLEEKTVDMKDDLIKMPVDTSAIINETEELPDIRNSYKGQESQETFESEKMNSNFDNDNFYVDYEKCKKEIDDLFKSALSKVQLIQAKTR